MLNELIIEQLYHCTNTCEARIDNGADIEQAFVWLNEEIERALDGEEIYPYTD